VSPATHTQPSRKIALALVVVIALVPLLLFGDYGCFLRETLSREFPSIRTEYAAALCGSTSCRAQPPQRSEAVDAADRAKGESFIIEEYKNATHEIGMRLEQEHLLFALKFTLIGAILGLIFRYYPIRSEPPRGGASEGGGGEADLGVLRTICLCGWGAVVGCGLIDVRLQLNTRIITDIGAWIRNCLEAHLLPGPNVGWETYFSEIGLSRNSSLSNFLNSDRLLLTGMLYLACVYCFVYLPIFSRRLDRTVAHELLAIARPALLVCVLLFGWSRLYYYFDLPGVNYLYVLLVLLATTATQLSIARLSKAGPVAG
jgi:hypothetical protein